MNGTSELPEWLTPDWETRPRDTNELHYYTPPGTEQWFYDTDPLSNQIGARLSRKGLLDLTSFDTAGIFKDLVSAMMGPGGPLSDVSESQDFGALSSGVQKILDRNLGDMFRSISSGGFSPGRARGALRGVSFDAMRDLLGRRAELISDRTRSRASAMEGIANVQAGQEIAEKDRTLSALMFDQTGSWAREAQSKGMRGSLLGAGIGALGTIAGGALGSGGLFGKGSESKT